MKKNFKNFGPAAGAVLAVLFLGSCSKDSDPVEVLSEDQNQVELTALLQADEAEWIAGEIVSFAEEVYAMEELTFSGKGIPVSGFIPQCAVITTVREGMVVKKTIDFSEGCETPNGNLLAGLIHLSFEADMAPAGKTITLALEGFSFNGIAVEGNALLERTRENANGNPQSEVASEFRATWPDGETASWKGSRTREWIQGYGSGFWGDNTFLITGSQTLENRLGTTFNRTVVSPLRRESACRFVVSGKMQVSRNDWSADLDFGDGSCDAFAELALPNGTVETITLRRSR